MSEYSNIIGVIYLTTNHINGKIYIGQFTRDNDKLDKYFGSGILIKKSINKYGKENFSKIILEECYSKEDLNIKEKYWINFYNSRDLTIGYNIHNGGNSPNKEKLRETNNKIETKIKRSNAAKKYMNDLNTKEKIKIINNKPEVKKKRSQSAKIMNCNKEYKEKQRKSLLEYYKNPENIEIKKNQMLKKWADTDFRIKMQNIFNSDKYKNNLSNSLKGKNNPAAKSIIATNTETFEILTFDTIRDACQYFNCNYRTIPKIITGKIKNKFLHWIFDFVTKK